LKKKGLDTYQNLSSIETLESARLESQRLISPYPATGRIVMQEVEFGDFILPKNSVFFVAGRPSYISEESYKDASSFVPDRWITSPKLPSIYPFGNGVHRCKGESFALISVKAAAAILFSEYDVKLVDGFPQWEWGINWQVPAKPCYAVITKRVK